MSEPLERIHPQVYRIPAPFANGVVHLYLLLGDQVALIDTGVSASVYEAIEPALKALGLQLTNIDLIVNTHAHHDHIGGNALLRQLTAAKILINSIEVPLTKGPEACLSSPVDPSQLLRLAGREDLLPERLNFLKRNVGESAGVDRELQAGDVIDLGRGIVLHALHTPGHTPGSTSFYWEQEGILFTGDSLQGQGYRAGWMPLYFLAADYMKTAARLAELPMKTLCLGHGYQTEGGFNWPVRQGEAAARTARESLALAQAIDAAVETALKKGVATTSLVEFGRAVLFEMVDDYPIVFDRTYGIPLHGFSSINAHLKLKQGVV